MAYGRITLRVGFCRLGRNLKLVDVVMIPFANLRRFTVLMTIGLLNFGPRRFWTPFRGGTARGLSRMRVNVLITYRRRSFGVPWECCVVGVRLPSRILRGYIGFGALGTLKILWTQVRGLLTRRVLILPRLISRTL